MMTRSYPHESARLERRREAAIVGTTVPGKSHPPKTVAELREALELAEAARKRKRHAGAVYVGALS